MKINLSCSQITNETLIPTVSSVLADTPSDQSNISLELWGNQLDTKGLENISRLLNENPRITELNLGYNKIKLETTEDIAAFNCFCQTIAQSNLKSLDLSGLRFIGDVGFNCLAQSLLAAPNNVLRNLTLTNTGFTDTSIPLLSQLLVACRGLCNLDLSKNPITYDNMAPLFPLFNKRFYLRVNLQHTQLSNSPNLTTVRIPDTSYMGPIVLTHQDKMLKPETPASLLTLCATFFAKPENADLLPLLDEHIPDAITQRIKTR